MWLIKLHFSFSVLCLITFAGFSNVCKEQIEQNGWFSEKRKKKYATCFLFFVPIMNALIVLILFLMICKTKEEFEKLTTYVKKESEE